MRVTRCSSKKRKYVNSLYGHMFLEDMCADFPIHFAPFSQANDFFTIKPHDSKLKQILEHGNFHFLRYDFSHLISKNMYSLLLDGICYVEMILDFENDELKSIQFIPLNAIRCTKMKKKIKFHITDFHGKRLSRTIAKQSIVKLDLRDLKIRRNHFWRILKGLSGKGIPDFGWLNKTGVSIADYDNRQVLNALRTVGDTYWDLRKSENEYMNEIYLLYRRIMYDSYRFRFFEYFLSQYNNALREIGLKHGFDGEIAYNVAVENHKKELEKLLAGEITCEQMADYLFKRKQ